MERTDLLNRNTHDLSVEKQTPASEYRVGGPLDFPASRGYRAKRSSMNS
jgi:hypothetical protein